MDKGKDTTEDKADPACPDRRLGDRRVAPSDDYTGPERRAGDRRSGQDRRRSPRF